ncbi:MAG: choice-of-anchor tandem repeat GloVer-containing protein [Bryobacteraceae bacterium]|jgi:uncharacterized repeat protein (TIGR03803 family)
MRSIFKVFGKLALCGLAGLALPAETTFTTLYSFCLQTGCTDGETPWGLVQAVNGDLYGTTYGSLDPNAANGYSLGTVFKISPSGTLKTVYAFCAQTGCPDGEYPPAGLVQGVNGELYGTTQYGGDNAGPLGVGGGTVFKISPAGKLTTLYDFCAQSACKDGLYPIAGLVRAANGDLYGSTSAGGLYSYGTIFKITPNGTLTTLYSFCSEGGACTDGQYPVGALIQARNGYLYGTTSEGGGTTSNGGTIFKITTSGKLTTLYRFCAQANCSDGANPNGLVQAADGDFYGVTQSGGTHNTFPPAGLAGTIFKITASGKLTTLYNFCAETNCADGIRPNPTLLQATDGDLYGTTVYGGAYGPLYGTVFKITPGGTLTTLHGFCAQSGCPDGYGPISGLIQATDGDLYGTASEGGANPSPDYSGGTVFRLSVGLEPFVKTLPVIGTTDSKVDILGNDLIGATSVSFNGTPAVFEVVSNSEITTTVPTGATSGTVEVVTPERTLKSNVRFEVSP